MEPLRVLAISDKFKGTLTAAAATHALARGWHRARPADRIRELPLTDGGDGFGDCLRRLLGARPRSVATLDAAHRPCRVVWWFNAERRLAIVESALSIGLAMLPSDRYHPFELDTFGLGAVLKAAARAGARRALVGIGGSATNDGGFGFARALGWRFMDRQGRTIKRWVELKSLASVVPPARRMLGTMRVVVATDVRNQLLGSLGASRVYGPQKGLRAEDMAAAEGCLARLCAVVCPGAGRDCSRTPGAGAAGGLGFGLMAFAGARLEPGLGVYARHARLDRHLSWARVVLTGEGCIDRSTLMGKGVGEIAARARSRGLACLAFGGVVRDRAVLARRFSRLHALAPDLVSLPEALEAPAHWLTVLAEQAAATSIREIFPR